jgi:hypothetical protein
MFSSKKWSKASEPETHQPLTETVHNQNKLKNFVTKMPKGDSLSLQALPGMRAWEVVWVWV